MTDRYLLLSEQKLRDIWKSSGLNTGSLVPKQTFGSDDFAVGEPSVLTYQNANTY